jgi:hypothetical protein
VGKSFATASPQVAAQSLRTYPVPLDVRQRRRRDLYGGWIENNLGILPLVVTAKPMLLLPVEAWPPFFSDERQAVVKAESVS